MMKSVIFFAIIVYIVLVAIIDIVIICVKNINSIKLGLATIILSVLVNDVWSYFFKDNVLMPQKVYWIIYSFLVLYMILGVIICIRGQKDLENKTDDKKND